MTTQNPFKYFKTSPKIIRLVVMYFVRYPLSFRQVEDILHERGTLIRVRLCQSTPPYSKEEAGPTTEVKTHTYRFDGESEQCSYLKQQLRSRGLPVITVKYTTTSIMKDIFKTDKLISKNAQLLLRSGSKSALHRFM